MKVNSTDRHALLSEQLFVSTKPKISMNRQYLSDYEYSSCQHLDYHNLGLSEHTRQRVRVLNLKTCTAIGSSWHKHKLSDTNAAARQLIIYFPSYYLSISKLTFDPSFCRQWRQAPTSCSRTAPRRRSTVL